MSEEIFDVVDEQDQVIGQATRAEVHARNLLHRAVNIFVFNSQGQMLLQMRSAEKDQFPSCYTSSASGHLDAGESYEAAAAREINEELGISPELKFVIKFPANEETAFEHSVLFRAVSDETPTFPKEEIAHIDFLEMDAISRMIADKPALFAPPFRVLFEWYYRTQTG